MTGHQLQSRTRRARGIIVLCALLLGLTLPASAAAQQLTAAEQTAIDNAANSVLRATGAPGASIAVVRGGQIVLERAYGTGRTEPATPATSAMRYAIGSVSKQFTATAILLLAEQGKGGCRADQTLNRKWHTSPSCIT